MQSFRKRDHVGAAPTGGSSFNGDHDVRVRIRLCESRRAGANPVGLPIVNSTVRKVKSRAIGLQNRLTQCESGAHIHFFLIAL